MIFADTDKETGRHEKKRTLFRYEPKKVCRGALTALQQTQIQNAENTAFFFDDTVVKFYYILN